MIKKLICFVFLVTPLLTFGQEEDYYKVAGKRSKNHELANLPHLQSKFSTFYLEIGAGFSVPFYVDNMDGFGESINVLNSFERIGFGWNASNKLFYETGLMRLTNELATLVEPTFYNPKFVEKISNTQYYLPLKFKKKIVSLNKITEDAAINLGLGTGILLYNHSEYPSTRTVDIQDYIGSPQIVNYFVTSSQFLSPMYLEGEIEIRGEIGSRLNIGVYLSGLIRKRKSLNQNFEIFFQNGQTRSYQIFERSNSFNFGLRLGLNSKKYYSYTSDI